MGLSKDSTGAGAADKELIICKQQDSDKVVALAGNPNVGKSTVFNELTGMHQHTGNWPGKTVTNAQGHCTVEDQGYVLVDLPGCYSLLAHSAEEEAARDFFCFGGADAAVVVCDATCLERNLNLVLQALEITERTVVCVNLLDEAKRKGVHVDLDRLSKLLGVPVAGTAARSGRGLGELMAQVKAVSERDGRASKMNPPVTYPDYIERALEKLTPAAERFCGEKLSARWTALRLLEHSDSALEDSFRKHFGASPWEDGEIAALLAELFGEWKRIGITKEKVRDDIVSAVVLRAESLANAVVTVETGGYSARDRKLDRIFTSRATGFPILFLLFLFIFWLTIAGANYPSALLSTGLFWLGDRLREILLAIHTPGWLSGLFIDGMYKTLAWVVSVMLPPMAIFFPLFTLLEDLGYLPRVAFNLDHCFQKCGACGKQSLTTLMGFGCNAAGVVGCRIIDSPRERLIAILTNNFVPCNGRLPMLISIITMFFISTAGGMGSSVLSALLLMAVILLGLFMTFAMSKFLSSTILKGIPSSFALELPPYRIPQVGKVLVRSIFDRTLFVLGRAVSVAAPAGLLIWILANVTVGGNTLLSQLSGFLDPAARLFGLDGVILLAFILGLPANEIVIPIILMAYLSQGSLVEMTDLTALHTLLVENGWTWVTALCTMLFSLMHWPCSTTCMTIYKETKSLKWTAVAFLLPTLCGLATCLVIATAARCFA
ncbi:MAG: ferrous iron transport protein B [Acutalibacter sp.]|nr:ferrous iron transport protein B [Acutalibacter sp.]